MEIKKDRQEFLAALEGEPNQTPINFEVFFSPSNYGTEKRNSFLEVCFRNDLNSSKNIQEVYYLESIFE